jgi:radical SAM superfamily enzyme YgiQ (UPF0313 family)
MSRAHFVLAHPEMGKMVSLNGITPPTGPTYLYSYAKSRDFGKYEGGRCVDLNIHDAGEFVDSLAAGDLVCLTATMANYRNTVDLARQAKEKGCTVAIGGSWASVKAKQIAAKQECIDHIVVGEGEAALADILSGTAPKGIIRKQPLDISSLPPPDFSGWTKQDLLTYQENYRKMVLDGIYGAVPDEIPFFVFYQSSRGCVQRPRCGFCGSRLGNCYTARTSEQFYRDIEGIAQQLRETNPRIHVFDCSDSFATGLPRFHEYRKVPGMTLTVYGRADEITAETATQLKAMGVTKVSVGVESGSRDVLQSIGKNTTTEQNLRAARLLKEAGVEMYAAMIYGSPGETPADLDRTVQHFAELASIGNVYRVGARIATVLPNSRWYFNLLSDLRQSALDVATELEASDTVDVDRIVDLWLERMTCVSRKDIEEAHARIVQIADANKVTVSSRVAKGLL